jgi:hypothetical protein
MFGKTSDEWIIALPAQLFVTDGRTRVLIVEWRGRFGESRRWVESTNGYGYCTDALGIGEKEKCPSTNKRRSGIGGTFWGTKTSNGK